MKQVRIYYLFSVVIASFLFFAGCMARNDPSDTGLNTHKTVKFTPGASKASSTDPTSEPGENQPQSFTTQNQSGEATPIISGKISKTAGYTGVGSTRSSSVTPYHPTPFPSATPSPEMTYVYVYDADNINCGGLVAQYGEWIYYTNYNDNKYLYKIKSDGSHRSKVFDIYVKSLNTLNNKYFYYYSDDNSIILASDFAGTTQYVVAAFADCIRLYVVGDWVYYYSETGIYKILADIEGDQFKPTQLVNNWSGGHSIESLNIVGDHIYYLDFKNMRRINTDGTGDTGISAELTNIQSYSISDGWIYFSRNGDSGLYKIKVDGTEFQTIYQADAARSYDNIHAKDGWIYYHDATNIYRLRTDGTGEQSLTDKASAEPHIQLITNWIYFINNEDKMVKMQTDGSNYQVVI